MKFKVFLLSIVLLVASGCQQEASSNVVDAELKQQLSDVQAQLDLVTKEVVSLHKKLDGLSKGDVQKGERNKGAALASVKLSGRVMDSEFLGNKSAEYALVEFMDYQCPYCVRHARNVFPKIKERYIDSGKLQYVVRDYPLSFHSQGKPAAIAAACAGKQNKFWEMHNVLAEQSRELRSGVYTSFAQQLDLDVQAFTLCMQDKLVAQHVDEDIAYGNVIGVNGTPRFYIGKIKGDAIVDVVAISGARSFDTFDQAIREMVF